MSASTNFFRRSSSSLAVIGGTAHRLSSFTGSLHMSLSRDGSSSSTPAPRCRRLMWAGVQVTSKNAAAKKNGHAWLMAYAAGPGRQIEKEMLLRFDMWGKISNLQGCGPHVNVAARDRPKRERICGKNLWVGWSYKRLRGPSAESLVRVLETISVCVGLFLFLENTYQENGAVTEENEYMHGSSKFPTSPSRINTFKGVEGGRVQKWRARSPKMDAQYLKTTQEMLKTYWWTASPQGKDDVFKFLAGLCTAKEPRTGLSILRY